MSYTNGLDKPDLYFNTVLYTGDATSDRTITNTFGTDFLWLKERNGTDWHHLWDKVRGDGKRIHTNNANAESDLGTYIALVSTGFKVSGGTYNNSGVPFVAWQWKANGSGSTNTDGSITSTVSVNTTSGFSIVSYAGNSTSGATIGHSLGTTPSMIIVKSRTSAYNWAVYHSSVGATQYLRLNSTIASTTSSTRWNDTAPTSSVFTLGNAVEVNETGGNYIAYCFAEKKGFSKFGSYTGNGNADGTFVYTGFKPAFLIIKRTDSTSNWRLWDSTRNTFNVADKLLFPDTSDQELTSSSYYMDLLSSGFKIRNTNLDINASGGTYIYMCFAENPLVGTNNIPATAR